MYFVLVIVARLLSRAGNLPLQHNPSPLGRWSREHWMLAGLCASLGTLVLTIIPGALVIYFVRNYIAKGFALGRV